MNKKFELMAPAASKMHPEIERDHPCDCPICGRRLEPKTVRVGKRKFLEESGVGIPEDLIARLS